MNKFLINLIMDFGNINERIKSMQQRLKGLEEEIGRLYERKERNDTDAGEKIVKLKQEVQKIRGELNCLIKNYKEKYNEQLVSNEQPVSKPQKPKTQSQTPQTKKFVRKNMQQNQQQNHNFTKKSFSISESSEIESEKLFFSPLPEEYSNIQTQQNQQQNQKSIQQQKIQQKNNIIQQKQTNNYSLTNDDISEEYSEGSKLLIEKLKKITDDQQNINNQSLTNNDISKEYAEEFKSLIEKTKNKRDEKGFLEMEDVINKDYVYVIPYNTKNPSTGVFALKDSLKEGANYVHVNGNHFVQIYKKDNVYYYMDSLNDECTYNNIKEYFRNNDINGNIIMLKVPKQSGNDCAIYSYLNGKYINQILICNNKEPIDAVNQQPQRKDEQIQFLCDIKTKKSTTEEAEEGLNILEQVKYKKLEKQKNQLKNDQWQYSESTQTQIKSGILNSSVDKNKQQQIQYVEKKDFEELLKKVNDLQMQSSKLQEENDELKKQFQKSIKQNTEIFQEIKEDVVLLQEENQNYGKQIISIKKITNTMSQQLQ